MPKMRRRPDSDPDARSYTLVPGLPRKVAILMSEYRNIEIERMHRAVEEMDEEESGFEQFVMLVLKCSAVMLAAFCGIFFLNWIEHFGRQ
jgi:hypothetical protein